MFLAGRVPRGPFRRTLPEDAVQGRVRPDGVCVLAKSLNPKSGAVFVPVRNDTVTGLLVTGFPGNGVFGYGTVGLSVTSSTSLSTTIPRT